VLFVGFFVIGAKSLAEIIQWLTGWKSGVSPMTDWFMVPRAIYGFIRTFLHLEFLWDGPRWLIASKMMAFGAALGIAAWRIWISRPVWLMRSLPFWVSLVPFLLVEILIGIWHYGSDTERWIFIAPLVWLAVAGVVSSAAWTRGAFATLLGLATINGLQVYLPATADTAYRDHALAIAKKVPDNAVIISPGLDWTSYIRLYTGWNPSILSLEHVAAHRRQDYNGFIADLTAQLEHFRAQGRPIVMLGILDPSTDYHRNPWPGFVYWGYSIQGIQAWARKYQWREERLDDPPKTRIFVLID
jgi:hypothetical protein